MKGVSVLLFPFFGRHFFFLSAVFRRHFFGLFSFSGRQFCALFSFSRGQFFALFRSLRGLRSPFRAFPQSRCFLPVLLSEDNAVVAALILAEQQRSFQPFGIRKNIGGGCKKLRYRLNKDRKAVGQERMRELGSGLFIPCRQYGR